MAQAPENHLVDASYHSKIPDGVSLMDLWQGSREETSEVSGILAEAIEDWLTTITTPSREEPEEVRAARNLARRYRYPYIDLLPPEGASPINAALFNELPVEIMLRH